MKKKQITIRQAARPERVRVVALPLFPWWAWLMALVVLAAMTGLGMYLHNPNPVNHVLLAYVAHIRMGDPAWVDTEEVDYHQDNMADIWGINTNSEWLAVQTSLIVPYFGYENLTPAPRYPRAIYFAPMLRESSFHVLGRYYPLYSMVLVNERFLYDVRRKERADLLLAVVVHELLHHQGGRYLLGTSEQLESATEAGTIEVLAAMCNHNNQLACRAFWGELLDYSLTAIENELPNCIYEGIRFSIEGKKDVAPYRKSMRFWETDLEGLEHIKTAYILKPWKEIIKPAAEGWAGFNTKIKASTLEDDRPSFLVADFDDIRYLLGWLLHLI